MSQGETNDQAQFAINDPSYFASQESAVVPDPKDMRPSSSQVSVQEQLPDGMSEKEITQQAAQGKNSGIAIIIIQLIAQLFLKTGIDKLWALFFTLQLLKSITIYTQSVPPASQIWIEQIRSLVDFEMLKPDPIIKLYDNEMSVKYIVDKAKGQLQADKEMIKKNIESSGMKSSDVFVNMSTIIFIVALVLLVLLVAIFLSVVLPNPAHKEKIVNKIKGAKDKFIWNGFIRSQSIGYLTTCLALSAAYGDIYKTNGEEAFRTCLILGVFLVFYPAVWMIYLMRKSADQLKEKEVQDRVSNLSKNLSLSRHPWAKYYYPIFMFRRLIFVIITIAVPSDSCIQMQVLIFSSSLYIIWYCNIWPHTRYVDVCLEIFNEVTLQLEFYHLMIFTDFYVNPREGLDSIKLFASYSFSSFMVLIIVVNIAYMTFNMYYDLKRALRLRNLKKEAQEEIEKRQFLIKKEQENEAIYKKTVPKEVYEAEQRDKIRQRRALEQISFEQELESQLQDKTVALDEDFSSSSSESQKSSRVRQELKKNLKKKVTQVKKKTKADPKKLRNAPGLGMETIAEQSEISFRDQVQIKLEEEEEKELRLKTKFDASQPLDLTGPGLQNRRQEHLAKKAVPAAFSYLDMYQKKREVEDIVLPPRKEEDDPLQKYLKMKMQQALATEMQKPEPATIVSAKTVNY